RQGKVGVTHGRERRPEHAVDEVAYELGRHLDREPRLTRSARPRDRDEPRSVAQQPGQLLELVLPADEWVEWDRKVRSAERAKRRKGAIAELEEAHRLR